MYKYLQLKYTVTHVKIYILTHTYFTLSKAKLIECIVITHVRVQKN